MVVATYWLQLSREVSITENDGHFIKNDLDVNHEENEPFVHAN